MVAAANPLAVQAGLAVLRRGGNAVDAAVAVQAMLGLVEPESSGVGGGAVILFHDARTGRNIAFLAREAAPAAATPRMFLQSDGKPMKHAYATITGRATGVPGAIAALWKMHAEYGKLAWRTLFGSAIRRSIAGFHVSPRLQKYIDGTFLQAKQPDVRRYLSRSNGTPLRAGDLLKNPEYARTLKLIAAKGAAAILTGRIAADIVARTHGPPVPGALALHDLASYRVTVEPALCRPYRSYVICAPPPPFSGVGLLELMGILEHTNIAALGPSSPQSWYLFAEASQLMYADRDYYVGDPAFVRVPIRGLLDPGYLEKRRALIGVKAFSTAPAPGVPAGASIPGSDNTDEPGGTSDIAIVDSQGNVVSMTTTIEYYFGSGRMVDGFFLNNELTDFSFVPRVRGRLVANAPAGGKRPRSSMTPVLVFRHGGQFYGAIGSPGGNSIPDYVAKSLVGILDWHMSVQRAIDLPNLVARGTQVEGEVSRFSPAIIAGLAKRGIRVQQQQGESSGLEGIFVRHGKLQGGSDPRREGVALQP
jgi:gamma-glutamyltranspeptidase / glutathione hydrolase